MQIFCVCSMNLCQQQVAVAAAGESLSESVLQVYRKLLTIAAAGLVVCSSRGYHAMRQGLSTNCWRPLCRLTSTTFPPSYWSVVDRRCPKAFLTVLRESDDKIPITTGSRRQKNKLFDNHVLLIWNK